MFNNLFGKKDKEEPKDYANMTVKDLQAGCLFEYDLKTWQVQEEYKYDWGDHCFSQEFKISSGKETLFLQVEDEDELELCLFQPVKIRKIDPDLPDHIIQNERPPKTLFYDNKKFYLDEESPGYFQNVTENKGSWTEMISWDYYDDDEDYCLSIEQWEERSFEASYGKYIEPYEISNILPKPA